MRWTARSMPPIASPYLRELTFSLGLIVLQSVLSCVSDFWSKPSSTMAAVDLSWHAPATSFINNLTNALSSTGTYGFIFNSSTTPDADYGIYNWCNMPHVRKDIYVPAPADYELAYVELIHRHHKRTPYASNSFPVESYPWNCNDEGLYYFGRGLDPATTSPTAETYWAGYVSPSNPFTPSGWTGTCQFPQITVPGLSDSHQHGADLYAVYHDLLHFLPSRSDAAWRDQVRYHATTNQITSQVAGALVAGMWGTTASVPLSVQAAAVDGLEPAYGCNAASSAFNAIKSHSNPAWQAHLTAAAPLLAALDDISGVNPADDAWHLWLDHYYDNLSARQCHAKPLPCKLVDGANSSTCVTQQQADAVYRLGQWEYSRLYRDGGAGALAASAASMGAWFADVAAHLRAAKDGNAGVIRWRHHVAHDGSISRVLAVLQVEQMVWPGMGSEVVFELYKKKSGAPATPAKCSRDNCLRQLAARPASATAFCPGFTQTPAPTPTLPAWLGNCADAAAVSSACACVVPATGTATAPASTATASTVSASGYYVRVLFSGSVLRSSNPSLGLMDMLPVETLLAYIDGLVGVNGSLVRGLCG